MQFTFSLEGQCPGCGKQLEKPGSVKANGHEAFVSDDGRLLESENTDLCLSDSDPKITCSYCGEELVATPQEE